jgi:hypothetical protein
VAELDAELEQALADRDALVEKSKAFAQRVREQTVDSNLASVKKLMNKLYHSMDAAIAPEGVFAGETITDALLAQIKRLTRKARLASALCLLGADRRWRQMLAAGSAEFDDDDEAVEPCASLHRARRAGLTCVQWLPSTCLPPRGAVLPWPPLLSPASLSSRPL